MTTDIPTFLVLEGQLHESGAFEVVRVFEDTWAEPEALSDDPGGRFELALLNDDGEVLARVLPCVHFPSGCRPGATRPGQGLIRAVVALHETARSLEGRVEGRVVFATAILPERPRVKVSVEHPGKTALQLRVDAGEAEVRVVAQLANNRRIGVDAQRQKEVWAVNVQSLEGLGKAKIVVEATYGGRTTRVIAAEVQPPEATVHGAIIEPLPEARWPWGHRGSLIGSLSDRNGRRVEWNPNRMFWRVDGTSLGSETLVAWRPDKEGTHTIELAYHRDGNDVQVLDKRTVSVDSQTAEQKEWLAEMSKRRSTA